MKRTMATIEFEHRQEVSDVLSALLEVQERMEKQGKKDTTKYDTIRQFANMLDVLEMEW